MSHKNWYLPWGWNMGIYSENMPLARVDSKALRLSYYVKADTRQTQVTHSQISAVHMLSKPSTHTETEA